MSYLPLYRRLRPQGFAQLLGQPHIVKTLKNAIVHHKLAHTYLFAGTRGTGKTSTARIFAKALNCPNSKEAEPCNHCPTCNQITGGFCMDVLEIDAASHTHVETVREFIIDTVNYTPVQAKYKVYIIDEVQKLSAHSFDALLKTLEEPPAHIFFILCTTDPHKLPATILSRCQRYDFRPISYTELLNALRRIAETEGFSVEEGALGIIASAAQGSLRDALVILEQAASFGGGEISVSHLTELLGLTGSEAIFLLAENILKQKTRETLELFHQLLSEGKDLVQMVKDLSGHFRKLLIIKVSREPFLLAELGEEAYNRFAVQAKRSDSAELLRVLRILMELKAELAYADEGQILWEMALVKLSQLSADPSLEAISQRIKALEKNREYQPEISIPEREDARLKEEFSPPAGATAQGDTWKQFLEKVKARKKTLQYVLADCQLLETGDKKFIIGIKKEATYNYNILKENKALLENILAEICPEKSALEIAYLGETESQHLDKEQETEHQQMVNKALELFEAKIVSNSKSLS